MHTVDYVARSRIEALLVRVDELTARVKALMIARDVEQKLADDKRIERTGGLTHDPLVSRF